jgi:hypothetical protein
MNKFRKYDYLVTAFAALIYTLFSFELVNYSLTAGILTLAIIYFFPIKLFLIPKNERNIFDFISVWIIGLIMTLALITPLIEMNLSLQFFSLALILINLFLFYRQYRVSESLFVSHLICKWIIAIAIFGF